MIKQRALHFFDRIAPKRNAWRRKNAYYWDGLYASIASLIPYSASVLQVGSSTGIFLGRLKNRRRVGIDFSPQMVSVAKKDFPGIDFHVMEAEKITLTEKFDYIVLSGLIGYIEDIEVVFRELRNVSHPRTKIIISYYNFLWEPILEIGECLGLRMRQPAQNWLSEGDISNLLHLAGFDAFKSGERMILPKNVPFISRFMNTYIAHLPILRKLCITKIIIAKPKPLVSTDGVLDHYSVSIVIPARNESGNIENAILRMPKFGKKIEIIFIEGNSTDDTWEKIQDVARRYANRFDIRIAKQDGKGKGDAVRKGFNMATGDILMILDADLTVPPEDLPKFYDAIASGKGEFINGSRLVYNMDENAMKPLNLLGNKFFSMMFTWLLDQRFKDTLCGTKVLFRSDYELIRNGRSFFGEFDPFGDYDLLFGASKLNLQITELPIRYKERSYGETNISRFRHGAILLRMCLFAAKKIKFIA